MLPKNCDADWLLTIAGPELFDGARKKGTESVPGGMESAWSWQEAWQGVALFSGMRSRKKDKHKRPHPDPLLEERRWGQLLRPAATLSGRGNVICAIVLSC